MEEEIDGFKQDIPNTFMPNVGNKMLSLNMLRGAARVGQFSKVYEKMPPEIQERFKAYMRQHPRG